MDPADPTAYIDAAAATLGIKIAAESRAGVARYFALALSMAELLQRVPLSPADEAATVFRPIEPKVDE